jgi:hypothetical protein
MDEWMNGLMSSERPCSADFESPVIADLHRLAFGVGVLGKKRSNGPQNAILRYKESKSHGLC